MIFLEHERSSKLADQTLTRQFRSARRIYWRKFFSQIKTSADYPWWTTGEIEQEQADGSLLPDGCSCEDFSRGTRWAQPKAERMPAVHHERYSSINFARNLCSIQKQHSSVSLTLSLNIKPAEEGWPYGNSGKACFQTEWPEGRLHKWAPAHSLAAQIY